jgi:transmembrane sensor
VQRWGLAAAAVLAVVTGALLWWRGEPPAPQRYATRHGEQQSWRLEDNSVLRLNTDTAVTVRYGRTERLVEIDRGQALFVVTHDPHRRFRVLAGAMDVVAVGTQFDVYRQADSTVVTVVEGQVSVGSGAASNPRLNVNAGGQVRVTGGILPAWATRVDAQRSTAWLNRQIAFHHEALAAVAAEFNRYGAVPIEIESPSLRTLVVSGVFAADDTETFLSFLRGLEGVTVETTSTRIRVFKPAMTPEEPRRTR